MKLKQTRLVTEDVERLAEFYEAVTGAGVQSVYGPDVVTPAMNRTAILDFEVDN